MGAYFWLRTSVEIHEAAHFICTISFSPGILPGTGTVLQKNQQSTKLLAYATEQNISVAAGSNKVDVCWCGRIGKTAQRGLLNSYLFGGRS
jgi:hypothetical protein